MACAATARVPVQRRGHTVDGKIFNTHLRPKATEAPRILGFRDLRQCKIPSI